MAAGFGTLCVAVSVAVDAVSTAGPVGWVPLVGISVLAVSAPLMGKQVLLEGCITLSSGVMAFAGLMFGLQLPLIPDAQAQVDAAGSGASADGAVAHLSEASSVAMVYMVMAVTAWLVAWVATRQLARLRESAERTVRREQQDADERAHAELIATLAVMRTEIESLRAEQGSARGRT